MAKLATILILLIISLLITSCDFIKNNQSQSDKIINYRDDGGYEETIVNTNDSIIKTYYDNGQLEEHLTYKKNGKLIDYKSYFKTGELEYDMIFNDDSTNIFRNFYKNGQLKNKF